MTKVEYRPDLMRDAIKKLNTVLSSLRDEGGSIADLANVQPPGESPQTKEFHKMLVETNSATQADERA